MDTANTVTSLKLTGGENWAVWKFQTEVVLKGRGLHDIVAGQSLEPEAAGEKAEWLKRDAKAQEILVTRIEQGPLTHLLSCTSSREMWSKLKSVYDKESVLEEIRTKLKQAGEPISDKMLMTKILMSLPEPYKHFRSAWESVPLEKQTTEELTSRLLIEEERVSSSEGEAVALAGTSSSRSMVMVKYVQ
ncbi:uncharacterized protein LOC123988147 [Osmia bicornis bicornis]|uniref:uncharacterized protein LOC123988147 n=1 Tax=Osmia bicornis bicornis TaxID=1437191 RepID=UPI001EAF8396|nr:uncharacterized protein LOC123988147 [Osmia bicornis bicornis]